MRYCKRCVLSDCFFSVKINKDGLCNYCVDEEQQRVQSPQSDLNSYIGTRKGDYDIILAYSGGKDSTYTLYLLKEKYKMNVLAVTYDNGYLAKETYANIQRVCMALNVNSLIVAPSKKKLNKVFNLVDKEESLPMKSLERASSICTYCIGLVKMCVYKEAIQRKIPLIAFGWTPGQINIHKQVVSLDYRLIKKSFKRQCENITTTLGEEYGDLLLPDALLEENADNMPSLFYPFPDGDYCEEQILDTIGNLGWIKPNGTDSNSTNCILNSYAIYRHKKKYGFHPYAFELAGLVRNGLMAREEALRRIEATDDMRVIKMVQKELDYGRDTE